MDRSSSPLHRPAAAGRRAGMPLVVAALLAGGSLAACGSGTPSASPTTAQPGAGRTTTRAPDGAAGALGAYRAMWADLVSAARTSDFQSPLLPQHAAGEVLTLFVQGLARDQLHGIVTRGQLVLDPRVTSLSPSRAPTAATVLDCFDDTHWIEYKTTGGLARNAPGGRRSTTAGLKESDGTWKVTQLTVGATGTC